MSFWTNFFSAALAWSNNKANEVWILHNDSWNKQGHIQRVLTHTSHFEPFGGGGNNRCVYIYVYKSIMTAAKIVRVLVKKITPHNPTIQLEVNLS
jgi:hypothetical protein